MNGRAQRGRVRSTLTVSPEGFLHEPGGSAPGGHRADTIPNVPDPFVPTLLLLNIRAATKGSSYEIMINM